AGGGILVGEFEQARYAAVADEARLLDRVGDEDLAEDLEVPDADRTRGRDHLRVPQAPEAGVDVSRGVDLEPVQLVVLDPGGVDLHEPRQDDRLLREEIVEAEDVTLLVALLRARREVDGPALVVVR